MKLFRTRREPSSSEVSPAKIDRRNLVLGVGVAGAAAAAAQALRSKAVVAPPTAVDKAPAETGDGYQVTAHVLRYYETTKI